MTQFSSIRNIPAQIIIPIKDAQAHEIVSIGLSKKVFSIQNNDKPAILAVTKDIDDYVNTLFDTNDKICFLENAYSACDVVQPFGTQPSHIVEILQHIRTSVEKIKPAYFSQIERIFSQIDIKSHINIAVSKLTADATDSEIENIVKELHKVQDLIVKKEIQPKSSSTTISSTLARPNSNKVAARKISLSDNSQYQIQPTGGINSNCLINSYLQGSGKPIERDNIFTEKNLQAQLKHIQTNLNGPDTFLALKTRVAAIYDEAKPAIEKCLDIDKLAQILTHHINYSNCYLDVEIAAPILSKELNQGVVIISPNSNAKTHHDKFQFRQIDNTGTSIDGGILNADKLHELESLQNRLTFIINQTGNHFEWLKKN